MYTFQSLELVLYAAILPVAMAVAGAYIIYGRDRVLKLGSHDDQ